MPNGHQKTWPRFAGYGDWRVPTAQELHSLVNCSSKQSIKFDSRGSVIDWAMDRRGECQGWYQRPTINQTTFPGKPFLWFWSASPHANYLYSAWGVDSSHGHVNYSYKGNHYAVRLVRGGQ